jgi:gluconate 2-dehydrogenase subunit 3-like protein
MDFRDALHLPNLRQDRAPADPDELPRQRRGTTPQMHGRYPDWDILAEAGHWDEVTRAVVLCRIDDPPGIHFFEGDEVETLKAYCDVVTHQYREPRIPVLAFVDEKLLAGRLDGYRYADMPDDGEAWRIVARGLDHSARSEWRATSFAAAPTTVREDIVRAFSDAHLRGGPWNELSVEHAWKVTTRHILEAFYAHPWSWNEIGFGGPAYPRGYAAFGSDHLGDREGWEPHEAVSVDPVQDTNARGIDR